MQTPSNILVLADDPTLVDEAAATLAAAGCRVSTSNDGSNPSLILRDWRDERRVGRTHVPMLTLDLALIQRRDLVEIVARASWAAGGGPRRRMDRPARPRRDSTPGGRDSTPRA
jgi:hypothetical protein